MCQSVHTKTGTPERQTGGLGQGITVQKKQLDFLSAKTKLVETETWEQIVGGIFFGGSTWTLRSNMDD